MNRQFTDHFQSGHRRGSLQVEHLESRALLACSVLGNAATLDAGELLVRGTSRADVITIAQQDNAVLGDPSDDTFSVVVGKTEVANCPIAEITAFEIQAGNGNDRVTIGDGVTVGAEVHGGNGHDTIEGGDGDDMLIGENGKDTIDGDDGNDFILGGNGNDILLGGAGTDSVEGANGIDILTDPDGDLNLNGGRERDTINGLLEPIPPVD